MSRPTGQSGGMLQGGFSFGTPGTGAGGSTGGTGFSFGSPATTTTTTGFTLGSTPAVSSIIPAAKPFSFGSAATSTQGTFSFGASTTTTTSTSAPAPRISLGTGTSAAQKPGSYFGAAPTTSTGTASTLPAGTINFGGGGGGLTSSTTPASAAQGFFPPGNRPSAAPTSTTGAGSGSAPTLFTSTASSLGSGTSTTSTGQGFKLGTATTATPAFGTPGTTFSLGLGLAKTTASTATTGTTSTTLGGIASTGATTAGTLGSFGTLASSTATTSTSSTPQTTVPTRGTASSTTPQLSYKQLEEQINKWVSDLEDYERTFLDQAAQVNAWDRMLMENGEKITELNCNVESVKAEQKRLDEELGFILAQQQELEVLLKPLEDELQKRTTGPGQLQHADKEREFTYGLAKDVDGQLKQMVGDLKSIIDHLNAAGSTQQENNDPIMQVAKILNAHMNSLQWIDQNAALLQRKVDEVSSLSEIRRKEQERNFRLAFD